MRAAPVVRQRLERRARRHAGRLVTHKQILTTIWGPAHADDTHYLRIAIGHIREKLGDDAAEPRFILTEPGVGYRLEAQR